MKMISRRMILLYSIIFLGSYMTSGIENNEGTNNKQPIKRLFGATKHNLRRDVKNMKRRLPEETCFEANGSTLCVSTYCNETDGYEHCTCELTIDGIDCDSCTVCDKDTLTFGFDCPSVGAYLDCP